MYIFCLIILASTRISPNSQSQIGTEKNRSSDHIENMTAISQTLCIENPTHDGKHWIKFISDHFPMDHFFRITGILLTNQISKSWNAQNISKHKVKDKQRMLKSNRNKYKLPLLYYFSVFICSCCLFFSYK